MQVKLRLRIRPLGRIVGPRALPVGALSNPSTPWANQHSGSTQRISDSGLMDPEALTDRSERQPIQVETGGLCHVRVSELPHRWSSGNAVSFKLREDGCAMDAELLDETGD